jgi:hypothetical protein
MNVKRDIKISLEQHAQISLVEHAYSGKHDA